MNHPSRATGRIFSGLQPSRDANFVVLKVHAGE